MIYTDNRNINLDIKSSQHPHTTRITERVCKTKDGNPSSGLNRGPWSTRDSKLLVAPTKHDTRFVQFPTSVTIHLHVFGNRTQGGRFRRPYWTHTQKKWCLHLHFLCITDVSMLTTEILWSIDTARLLHRARMFHKKDTKPFSSPWNYGALERGVNPALPSSTPDKEAAECHFYFIFFNYSIVHITGNLLRIPDPLPKTQWTTWELIFLVSMRHWSFNRATWDSITGTAVWRPSPSSYILHILHNVPILKCSSNDHIVSRAEIKLHMDEDRQGRMQRKRQKLRHYVRALENIYREEDDMKAKREASR